MRRDTDIEVDGLYTRGTGGRDNTTAFLIIMHIAYIWHGWHVMEHGMAILYIHGTRAGACKAGVP